MPYGANWFGSAPPDTASAPDAMPVEVGATQPAASNLAPCLAVAALLLIFFLQVFLTSLQMSPGYDEVSNLPSGYVFLRTGQWHVMPGHPPLIFALSALPLMALDLRLDLNDPWLTRDPSNPWNVGVNFLTLNNADERIFFWGRLPILILALLLGWFIYRWARQLYGVGAGVMALFLYAFCPTFIAHSGIVSYDIGVTFFSTLSLYFLWRFATQGTWQNLLWTGLLLGCALASKTPAVILVPVFAALLLLAVWWRPTPQGGDAGPPPSVAFPLAAGTVAGRLLRSSVALGLVYVIAFGVVYTVFLFPADPLFYARLVLSGPHVRTPTYPHYLMGKFRPEGWWYYFLVAYLIKAPVPMLLLIPLAFWRWWRERRGWFNEVFLLLPAVAVFVLMSAMAYQIGVRYLLPAFPLLFIFVSRTAPLFTRSRVGAAAGIVLFVWYLSIPVRIYPDYLAYFNELIGGPRHGLEYLDDSNIEWGQHLKRLKRYVDAHHLDGAKVIYFTTGRPEYYGIRAQWMRQEDMARPPEPGTYIVGAYDLVRAKAYYGVDWLERYPVVDTIGYSIYVFKVP